MRILIAGVLTATIALAGCGSGTDTPQAPPPPVVVALTLTGKDVPNIIELPGRIEAVRTAEVRARVDGIVQRRLFEEGSDVPEGTPLFQIDPREKRALLQQAQATLQRWRAARANAASIVARYEPLVARKAVSAQEYDAALSELRQADANIAEAQAAVAQAQLQLSYTTVRAPIAGRAGRAQVTEGALVSAAGATLMTNVDQLAPVYATFTQSSSSLADMMDQARSGTLDIPALERIEVQLVLENGRDYGEVGHLDFAGLSVDPSTGSQMVRAKFPNRGRTLLPGQFVRGRILAGVTANGVSVPQRAVQIADEEASVTVVGRDNTAQARPVELGGLVDGQWIIRSGLKPGDRVIVEGWQKVRPGQKVQVKGVAPASPTRSSQR